MGELGAVDGSLSAGVAFCAYLAVVLGIGVWASRRSSGGLSEFFLAGRKLGRTVVALSAVVSGRSAWLLLGVSGLAYLRGVSAVWWVLGYIVVEFLLFWCYAPRLRRFSGRHDCITLPDFFAARFPSFATPLRVTVVLVILVFLVNYVAAQFVAGGTAFSSSFDWTREQGLFLTAAIVLGYTVLGGFLAVSLTDLLQAGFMLIALVLLPVLAFAGEAASGGVLAQLRELDPKLVDVGAIGAGALIGALGIGLGSPGNPHILVRYMSIDDPDELRRAAWIGTAGNAVMAAGAIAVGLAGRVSFPELASLPNADEEAIFTVMAAETLHPVVFGLVVAAVFAAIMSTADSQLLVCASGVVRDIHQKLLRRGQELDPRRLVVLSRWVVAGLVFIAVGLALAASDLVFWFVLFSWAGLGAALGPTSILALFWRRCTGPGVLAGMIVGTLTVIVWKQTPALKALLYELVAGFVLSALAVVVVSALTRPEDEPGLE